MKIKEKDKRKLFLIIGISAAALILLIVIIIFIVNLSNNNSQTVLKYESSSNNYSSQKSSNDISSNIRSDQDSSDSILSSDTSSQASSSQNSNHSSQEDKNDPLNGVISSDTKSSSPSTSDTDEKSTIISVPYINQNNYPTGCESCSTVMMLNFWDIDISVDNFIDNYLDTGEIIFDGDTMYAPDPNKAFVGNPRSDDSYGCYAPVIVNSINKIISDKNLNFNVQNVSGTSLKNLCKEYIDNNMPVVVWASIDMEPTKTGASWIIHDTGKEFTWTRREHCLVLVGYDDNHYYFNDPYENNGVVSYPKDTCEKRYSELFKQAVVMIPN